MAGLASLGQMLKLPQSVFADFPQRAAPAIHRADYPCILGSQLNFQGHAVRSPLGDKGANPCAWVAPVSISKVWAATLYATNILLAMYAEEGGQGEATAFAYHRHCLHPLPLWNNSKTSNRKDGATTAAISCTTRHS
eukprot:4795697-Amphidinium_carterae.1